MGDSQQILGGDAGQVSPDSVSGSAAAAALQDADPTLTRDLSAAYGPRPTPAKPPAAAGKMASLWETVKQKAKQFVDWNKGGLQYGKDLADSVTRGELKGVDQISNTLLGAGSTLLAKPAVVQGLKLGVLSDNHASALLHWLDEPAAQTNPLQFGDDRLARWYGPARGGIPGAVEGITQFGVGLLAANAILPGGGILGSAVKQGVAGAIAFDPHQQRLSNIVENFPALSNPVTRFLSAGPDDTDALGHVKSALEGIVTAGTVESFVGGLKYLKAVRAGDAEGATKIAAATKKAVAEAQAQQAVRVAPTADGQFAVTPNDASPEGAAKAATSEPTAAHPTFTSQGQAENFAASVNYAANNMKQPVGQVGENFVQRWQKAMKGLAANPDPLAAAQQVEKYGLNPNYIQSPDEIVNSIKSVVEADPHTSALARGKVKPWAETIKGAMDLFPDGTTPDEALARIHTVFGNTERLDEYIAGSRLHMQALARSAYKLSALADADPTNAVATDQLAEALQSLHDFHAHFTGTNANVARALAANKIPVGEALQDAANPTAAAPAPDAQQAFADATGLEGDATGTIEGTNAPRGPSSLAANAPQQALIPHRAPPGNSVTSGLTRPEIRSLARMTFMSEGDPGKILAVLRGPRLLPPEEISGDPVATKNWMDYALGYRIEAMLSGPKTLAVTTASNAMTAFQRPAEYWWAGVRSSNPALKQQGADMLGALWGSMGDAWSAARRAFATGSNVLDPKTSIPDAQQTLGSWDNATWLQRMFHAPSRFHMASSEFFKQLNYRANVQSQILRSLTANGVTDPATIAERMTDDMKFAFDPQGGAANPLALNYAQVGTFQNDLGEGTIGKWLQTGAQKHPLVRLILPFVRTPTNIFRYAWERTPGLAQLSSTVRDDLAAGGERAAIAKAKTDMGLALYSSAGLLAAAGQTTGGGPADPELRRQWKEAGNQPYSVKIPGTDRWVSYRRADPTFAPLGLVADLYQMSHDLHDTDLTDLGSATIASIMSNLTSKTYMQGASEFMDAMHSGRGDVVQNLLSSTAGSFVPNVLRQLNPDNTTRETRGMMDEMMARVPGFSTLLEPRRNLFGEKVMLPPGYLNDAVNPFTVASKPDNQNVADELVKLGRAFSMPKTTASNGLIDLTDRTTYSNGGKQSPYDRMMELIAHPTDGPSLRSRMESLVTSDAYQHASNDSIINVGGERWNLANRIIQGAQAEAWGHVLKEYPKLQQAIGQGAQLNAASLSGGTDSVKAVLTRLGDSTLARPTRQ